MNNAFAMTDNLLYWIWPHTLQPNSDNQSQLKLIIFKYAALPRWNRPNLRYYETPL